MSIRITTIVILIFLATIPSYEAFGNGAASPHRWEIDGFLSALNDSNQDTVNFALRDQHAFVIFEAMDNASGQLGEHAKELPSLLVKQLSHEDNDVRRVAAQSLLVLGRHAKEQAPVLAELLSNKDEDVRRAAVQALILLAPLNVEHISSILIHRYHETSRTGEIRYLAHFLGGGAEEVETLLDWLGGAEVASSMSKLQNNYDKAVKTLEIFIEAWPSSEPHELLRTDFVNKIQDITIGIDWKVDDYEHLKQFKKKLEESGFTSVATALQQEIDKKKPNVSVNWGVKLLFVHAIFWLVLIFAYPRSPLVQATFFWNRWVRLMAGLGYVGFLLTWVPFLRRQLFTPFKESLLADARIFESDEKSYFEGSTVRLPNDELQPISEAFSRIRAR